MRVQYADYRFGGYLLTKPIDRLDYMDASLLPKHILTASPCIAAFVPEPWMFDWVGDNTEMRCQTLERLQIEASRVPALTKRLTSGFGVDFGWPNIVKSRQAVLELLELLSGCNWTVLGLALHQRHAEGFLSEYPSSSSTGIPGVYEMIRLGCRAPDGGVALGFELLGFEAGGDPHSWLCNGLETVCARDLGILPRSTGFLPSEADAERATEHISRYEIGAEPVLWLPWLLLDYTDDFLQA